MKLASWVYWPIGDLKRGAKRKAAVQVVRKTGIDMVLGIWGATEIIENGKTLGAMARELADGGVEMHIGICPWAAPAGANRARLYQYEVGGKRQYGNLCPSWPENRELVARTVEEICGALPVEAPGLHLDFIRYLFSAGVPWKLEWEAGREWIDTYHWCVCEACAAARARWLSRAEFTAYDRQHPGVVFKEMEFRKRNVNEMLGRVRAITRAHGKVLSIAQRVQYLNRAVLEGQDWVEWAEQGWYDFTCPMNYTTDTATYRQRLAENMPRLAGRGKVKVYEGVSRRSSAGESPIGTVVEQMEAALDAGADGVTLFHLGVLKSGEHEVIARWKRGRGGGKRS